MIEEQRKELPVSCKWDGVMDTGAYRDGAQWRFWASHDSQNAVSKARYLFWPEKGKNERTK